MKRKLFDSYEDIYDKAISLIKTNHKHEHRQQTIDVADFWHKMVYGLNQEEWICSYRPSEDTPQQKQRIRVYKTRTKYLLNKVRQKVKKSDRVDYAVDQIKYIGSNSEAREEDLQERLGREFSGGKTAKQYINEQFNKLNEVDPNAFMGVNFFEYNNLIERPYVYPIVIESKDVYDWCYVNGVLQYVWFNKPVNVQCIENRETVVRAANRFHLAAAEYMLVFQEVLEDEVEDPNEIRTKQPIRLPNGDIETYYIEALNHKSSQVPFQRPGYVLDPITNGETFESIYYPAKEILESIVIKSSELDVMMLTHGIIQKFAYVPSCEYEDKLGNQCNVGLIDSCGCDEDTLEPCNCKPRKCKVCHGTGKKQFHQSSQDIVTLELGFGTSTMKEDFIDLEKLIHTVKFDPSIFDLYTQNLKELEADVSKAFFGIDVFNKDANEAKTPEAIRKQYDAIGNVLFEYCTWKAIMYEFVVVQTAIYMDQIDGLQCAFKPPTDFKLDSLDDLINQYNLAAGLPKNVKDGILGNIYHKQNQDNPENLRRIRSIEKWRPFGHLSESERMVAMDALPEDYPEKILWLHFDRIFCDIENARTLDYRVGERVVSTTMPFYDINDYGVQKSIIEIKIDEYRERVNQFQGQGAPQLREAITEE